MPLEAPVRQPEGFDTVAEVLGKPHDTFVNVIGVVEHILPTTSTNGSDLQFTIAIQDRSVAQALGNGAVLKVKFFFPSELDAPKVEAIGDTVLLRRFKLRRPRGGSLPGAFLLKHFNSEYIVFPSSSMPDPHFNDSYAAGQMLRYTCKPPNAKPPTAEQQMWAISLRHHLSPTQAAKIQQHTRSRPGREAGKKSGLIKNIGPDQFFDIVVEVVKMYPFASEIYVTDYTENNLLYRYNHPNEEFAADIERDGDEYGYTTSTSAKQWSGPYGQMTLQVKLWEPHASFASSKIKDGDIIELQNVHIKMDPSGTKIEGVLHQDKRYPSKVYIQRNLAPARVHELKSRKEGYLARLKSHEQRAQGKPKKRDKKRRDKKEKKVKPDFGPSDERTDELEHYRINSHVKCERLQDPTLCLADIEGGDKRTYKTPSGIDFELPFINATYRARVRVIDFWPQKLEDFSRSLADHEYNDTNMEIETQSSTSYSALSASTQRWEWHFCLLVEDTKQQPGNNGPVRVPLLVFDKDAECLLRLDAADLRKDKKTLDVLRRKLFILWGNLEELKAKGLDPLDGPGAQKHSRNAFDCCIKEAGVKVQDGMGEAKPGFGYQRVYHLCGTTIHD